MGKPLLADDFLDRILDLERRMIAIERSPQLTSSSIKDGALKVLDASGIVRAQLGKQADGSYDIASFDAAGANPVKLSTLAFGARYDEIGGPEESTTSTTYTDLATVGPTVTTTIGPLGKAIVLAGAYMTSTVTNQSVVTALAVDGSIYADMSQLGNNTGGSIAGDHSGATIVSGLTPGSHQFRLKYLQSLPGATGRWAARWILVLPF